MVLMSVSSSLTPMSVRISRLFYLPVLLCSFCFILLLLCVFVSHSNEWCEFPTYLENCKPHLGPSASQDQTLVLAGLVFSPSSDELERPLSPGHGHFLCLLQESSKNKLIKAMFFYILIGQVFPFRL